MRKIEVCKKCDYFSSPFSSGVVRCICLRSLPEPCFNWKWRLPEDFKKEDVPDKCPYKLEHEVLIQAVFSLSLT